MKPSITLQPMLTFVDVGVHAEPSFVLSAAVRFKKVLLHRCVIARAFCMLDTAHWMHCRHSEDPWHVPQQMQARGRLMKCLHSTCSDSPFVTC